MQQQQQKKQINKRTKTVNLLKLLWANIAGILQSELEGGQVSENRIQNVLVSNLNFDKLPSH